VVHRFTYRDLLAKADILAADLLKKGLGTEEPVGIVVGPVERLCPLNCSLSSRIGCLDHQAWHGVVYQGQRGQLAQFNVLPIETVLNPEYQTEKHGEINAMSGKSEGHRSTVFLCLVFRIQNRFDGQDIELRDFAR
jgi:hypothetical protein